MTEEAADRRPPTGAPGRPESPESQPESPAAGGETGPSVPPGYPPPGGYPPGPGLGGYAAGADPWGEGPGQQHHHGYVPGGPPPGGTPFTSRYGLVRPRQGRYLAGVCAAIGRATNTDPILWRVLLAVLGFFGGIGIVVYLAAWLIIPAEGDSASPVESMLGRGRSSMSPILVIILGVLVAVLFGYIVTDAFRAVLLGAAILIGGALLLNRDASAGRAAPPPHPGAGGPGAPPPPPTGPVPTGAGTTAAGPYPGPYPAGGTAATTPGAEPAPDYPSWYHPAGPAPGTAFGTPAHPGAEPYASRPPYPTGGSYPADPPAPPGPPPTPGGAMTGPSSSSPPPVPAGNWPIPPVAGTSMPPPKGGYRPAFAPHGPYAPAGAYPPVGRAPKRPKPPKERSPLGAATFSMIFVAIGLVAIFDLVNAVQVWPSTYFAAVLITIALGLLVGAWFGRARWLIVLGLVASAALGISTLAESYNSEHADSPVVWRPTSHDALAERYQARFGDATLDLREIDFTGQDTPIEVRVDFGKLRVLVPPEVDTTVLTEVNAGDARIFDTRWSGVGEYPREVSDLGPDGAGGGSLRLILHVRAGDAEVTR